MRTSPDKLVIYDIDYAPFMANRALDAALMSQYPGASAIVALAERLGDSGVEMMTADTYLASGIDSRETIVLSNEVTRFTRTLLFERGLHGSVCLTGESPIVAWRFYGGLAEYSSWFDHVVLFPGARALATGGAAFHDFSWPYPDLTPLEPQPWDERSLLAKIGRAHV